MSKTLNNDERPKGSVIGGFFIMLLFSILLGWLPIFGPLVAGIIGGKKSGSMGNAFIAAILPAIIIGFILFSIAGLLSGYPLMASIAGAGGFVLAIAGVGPLLLGAVVGGALS